MPSPGAKLTRHIPLKYVTSLDSDWTFHPSKRVPVKIRLRRALLWLRGRERAPAFEILRQPQSAPRWLLCFLYAPEGTLSPAQQFTLDALRRQDAKLLVVCATPGSGQVPQQVLEKADAVCWKALPGYDFSAYGLGLRLLAEHAPGASVLVMNDSVLGPFSDDLGDWIDRANWDLTGFTASSAVENHIQSYAFILKRVDAARMRGLASVFPTDWAARGFDSAVALQETRFARVASKTMSVGAFWHADAASTGDPSLFAGTALCEAGMPFLKRSLLGQFSNLHDPDALEALLRARGHPLS